MTVREFKNWTEQPGHVLLDLRLGSAFSERHIPGAVSAPYRKARWAEAVAKWVRELGPDVEVGLFADHAVIAEAGRSALKAQGIFVQAIYDQGIRAWEEAGFPVVTVENLTVDDLAAHRDAWSVIDVREPFELRTGIIPGARTIPMGRLEEELPALPRDRRYAIVCATGNRSQSVAAYMADHGFQVASVTGGMSLWLGAGHPVERPS